MIRKYNCQNFRNISCSELEFDRINILIGANNAGKSNFIRALSFAANMVNNPRIETTGFLSEIKRNGWNGAVNKTAEEADFSFPWNLELPRAGEVEEKDFMEGYAERVEIQNVRYSKTRHGGKMLTLIDPARVAEKCPHCFRQTYYELKNL